MKRFIMSLFMLIFAFFFAGCNPKEPSDNGGGTHVEVVNFSYEFDQEAGVFNFFNYENGELVLVINGETHNVKQNVFDVKSVIKEEGEYGIYLYYYQNGSIHEQNYFVYGKTENKNGYLITFYDEHNKIIKSISRPSGYILSMDDFPLYENVTGMTFSWDDLSYVGKQLNKNIEINLIVEYETFTINYHLNGGEFESEPLREYTVNAYDLELTVPYKNGFVFDGWYDNASFSGDKVVKLDILNPRNIDVYAKWIELTASAKELVNIINNTLNQPAVTYSIKSNGKNFEYAIDTSSSSIYAHSKEGKNYIYVIENNKYYDFSDSTFNVGNYDKKEYADPLDLKTISGQFKNVTSSKKLGKQVYDVELVDGGYKITFTVENNLISKIKSTYGDDSEEYTLSYTCKKASFDRSSFKEKNIATIYLIEIRNGIVPEELSYQGEHNVTGKALKDVETINHFVNAMASCFGGIYLDEEMKNEVDLNYRPTSSLNVYLVDYGNPEEAALVYEFDLNVYCQCEECNDVKSYKDITVKDLYKVKHFEDSYDEGYDKFFNFHKVENNKLIMGWFTSNNKDSEMFNGFNFAIANHLQNGKYYEDLVINLYSVVENVETVLVKEYCDCDLHADKGYVENYYVKGNYYFPFNNSHKKEGYICNYFTVSNSDQQHIELELTENVSIYLKWEIDSRITVNVHSTFTGDKSSITGEADKIYYQIKDNYDGLYDEEYILEGLYLDAAFIKKVTENTQISNNADIYLKFVKGQRVIFEVYNGETFETCLPSTYNFDDINWLQYAKETEQSGFESQLGGFVYRLSSYGEYVVLFEFYEDRNLTKKVSKLNDLTHIYLGYKEHPLVSIQCVDDCNHYHEEVRNNQTGLIYKHEYYDEATEKTGYIEYYLDEECTKLFNNEIYNYQTENYTVYGKFKERLVDYTIHCNCLNHPNGITGSFNSIYLATLQCDYGYDNGNGPSMEGVQYYLDPECHINYWENVSDENVELWVKEGVEITLYCDCPIHSKDNGIKLIAFKENEPHTSIYNYFRDYHHFAINGVEFEIFMYINNDRNNVLYEDNSILKDNDKVYCEISIDPNFTPITIHYGDESISSYYPKDAAISLQLSYGNYKVEGYYLDSEFKVEADTVKDSYNYSMYYFEGLTTLYAKLVEAPKATFTYLSFYEGELTSDIYIFDDNATVETLYYMMKGKVGYIAYIVDENNNRCYPMDKLRSIHYTVNYEKISDYVEVVVNCDCTHPCYQDRYGQHMDDDGSIRVLYQDNIIYAKIGESCMREVYEAYGYHCNEYECYDLYNATILVNGVEVLDKSIFDYMYGMEMPPHLKDPFIFTENSTIEISSSNK